MATPLPGAPSFCLTHKLSNYRVYFQWLVIFNWTPLWQFPKRNHSKVLALIGFPCQPIVFLLPPVQLCLSNRLFPQIARHAFTRAPSEMNIYFDWTRVTLRGSQQDGRWPGKWMSRIIGQSATGSAFDAAPQKGRNQHRSTQRIMWYCLHYVGIWNSEQISHI